MRIYIPPALVYVVIAVIVWTFGMALLTRLFDPAAKLERRWKSPWPRYVYVAIFGPLAWGAVLFDYYDTLKVRRDAPRREREANRRRREDREWGVR